MNYPPDLLTRQQVADRASLTDDVLTFWIRQGLLVTTSGGLGRGSHRRFDIFQVNVAAVLAELRRFGVNVAVLRQVADLLQRGTALALAAPCNFWGISDAIELASLLARHRRGEPVTVIRPDIKGGPDDLRHGEDALAWEARNFRAARDEAEIVNYFRRGEEDLRDDPDAIVSFARMIGEEDALPLQLFVDLNHSAFRYVWDGYISDWGDSGWILVPSDDGLAVFRGPAEHDLLGKHGPEVRSGLFLGPAAIFRAVWKDDLRPLLVHERPQSPERREARRRAMERAAMLRARLGTSEA